MSIVNNVKIYDLEESMHASGYPMRITTEWEENSENILKRCTNLSHAADWVGAHDQFLSGIHVSFDLTFSNKAWVELERYRFISFISSQSTIHCMLKFDLDKQYNRYVDPKIIEIMKEKAEDFNNWINNAPRGETEQEQQEYENILDRKYLEIVYSNPAGFLLTARLTTNYRCLKNVWRQRRHHRLPEWREFCQWIETLPYAKELICYERRNGENEKN